MQINPIISTNSSYNDETKLETPSSQTKEEKINLILSFLNEEAKEFTTQEVKYEYDDEDGSNSFYIYTDKESTIKDYNKIWDTLNSKLEKFCQKNQLTDIYEDYLHLCIW